MIRLGPAEFSERARLYASRVTHTRSPAVRSRQIYGSMHSSQPYGRDQHFELPVQRPGFASHVEPQLPALQVAVSPSLRGAQVSSVYVLPSVLQVRDTTPLHVLVPGLHVPVHSPSVHTAGQTRSRVHVPESLHTSRVWFAAQRVLSGKQLPVQVPVLALHALFVQVVPLCQLPLSSQLRGVCSAQSLLPGLHTPEQRPAPLHTNAQARSGFHVPRSQARGVRPLQSRAPGLHSPVHSPAPLHTNGQAACGSQVPIGLHSSGMPAMLQRRVPGEQLPPQLPLEHTFGHAAPAAIQLPSSPQISGVNMFEPPQRRSPGLHVPAHSPSPLHTNGHGSSRSHVP